ncbi:MAG: hypothetical protein ACRCT7_08595 [Shewanella sp.]
MLLALWRSYSLCCSELQGSFATPLTLMVLQKRPEFVPEYRALVSVARILYQEPKA